MSKNGTGRTTHTDEAWLWRHYSETLRQNPLITPFARPQKVGKENIKAFIFVMIFPHILFGVLKETKESSSEYRWWEKGEEKKRWRRSIDLNMSVKMSFSAVHHHVWNDCALIAFVITLCTHCCEQCLDPKAVLVLPLYEQHFLIKYSQMLFFPSNFFLLCYPETAFFAAFLFSIAGLEQTFKLVSYTFCGAIGEFDCWTDEDEIAAIIEIFWMGKEPRLK